MVNNIPPETCSFRSEVSGRAPLSGFWLRLSPALLVLKGAAQGRGELSPSILKVKALSEASDQPLPLPFHGGVFARHVRWTDLPSRASREPQTPKERPPLAKARGATGPHGRSPPAPRVAKPAPAPPHSAPEGLPERRDSAECVRICRPHCTASHWRARSHLPRSCIHQPSWLLQSCRTPEDMSPVRVLPQPGR